MSSAGSQKLDRGNDNTSNIDNESYFKSPMSGTVFPFGISRSKTMPPPSTAPSISKTISSARNSPNTPLENILTMRQDQNNIQLKPSSESSRFSPSEIRYSPKALLYKSPTASDKSSRITTIITKPSSSTSSLRQVLFPTNIHTLKGDDKEVKKEEEEGGVFFEEKMAHLTHLDLPNNNTAFKSPTTTMSSSKGLTAPEYVESEVRSNSLDEVVSHIYQDEDEKEKLDDSAPYYDKEDSAFSSLFKTKPKAMKYFITLVLLILALSNEIVFTSFPFFTCHHDSGACFPQLTVQITDKSPAAKTALVTVKEALKVLTYLAIDFGDSTTELDFLNSRLDTYYQEKVIDTFSVNTLYQLNFLGYCRVSSKRNGQDFCMRSYGLDILAVFVRDAGVQLGQLTRTNIDIMGDSFALAYELAISGFNQFTNTENHSVEYIDYAILLQKFSKGLGFLTVSQFVLCGVLLWLALVLLILKYRFLLKNINNANRYFMKKCILISMISLSFLSVLVGFLICSLTFEYILKLSEVGQKVGIANVNRASGFTFIWISFVFQILECCFIIYLANGFRKRLF